MLVRYESFYGKLANTGTRQRNYLTHHTFPDFPQFQGTSISIHEHIIGVNNVLKLLQHSFGVLILLNIEQIKCSRQRQLIRLVSLQLKLS